MSPQPVPEREAALKAFKLRIGPYPEGELTKADREILRAFVGHVDACRAYLADGSKAAVMNLCIEALDQHLAGGES